MPDQFAEQLHKLEFLRHQSDTDSSELDAFDAETEQLILRTFGESARHLEAYELATVGEAENIVNIPQAAQEDGVQDLFHKGLEQRRQVLEACLAELNAGLPANKRVSPPSRKKTARPAKKKPRAARKKASPARKKRGGTKKRKPARPQKRTSRKKK